MKLTFVEMELALDALQKTQRPQCLSNERKTLKRRQHVLRRRGANLDWRKR